MANLLFLLLIPFLVPSWVNGSNIRRCEELAGSLQLADTIVHITTFVPAKTNISLADVDPTCSTPFQIASVEFCRVILTTTTGPGSEVSFEAWLPLDWSGRFLGVGNGGLSGCIKYEDLDYGASNKFATIGSDNGHAGTSGRPFLNSPGTIEDYSYRAVHLEAQIGKLIVREFYGKEHDKAYYLGCSTGGRQGFKEAQSFPDDFDGIVAGAPAFDLIALMYWTGQFFAKTGDPSSPRFLTSEQWNLVYEDVLKQCDHLDGYRDGVIEDPDLCQYRPEALVCQSESSGPCITGQQAATVRDVFSPVYGGDGQLVYPRMQPGSNATERFYNGKPHPYPQDWFRYVVYKDPEWNAWPLKPEDYKVAASQDPFQVSTWEGDLSKSRDRGTKIIHYHGLEDNAISSDNSARYYDYVSRTMNASSAELDYFYRYFRISGLSHCRGGNGANMIGSNWDTFSSYEADQNVLAAIVKWVEEGIAPDYVRGSRVSPSQTIEFQRKHCRYPTRNVYVGHGDPDDANSWVCS